MDTGVFFNALVEDAPQHLDCRRLLKSAGKRLITTSFVIDELLTLLSARGQRDVALACGQDFVAGRYAEIQWIDIDDVKAGWEVFRRFSDKQWSFTDCTSYAVMQRLGVTEALALDDHFRQFGSVSVRP